MNENFKKLVDKLIELFMLNQPDLDFGIYRIMNSRRREITKFLEEDLLPQVRDALNQYESGSNANLSGELKKAVDNAKELGVDPDSSPKVKELKAKITEAGSDISQVENEVYSHLYNFFSRYYSGGDFLSLRRYKEGVYAIPYEGEEVKLYWANHDQYYIKTNEYLRDYKFNLPNDKKAHFKLTEADIEKDNRKESAEKERRFVLAESDFWSVEDGEVVLKFHYLPLGEKDSIHRFREVEFSGIADVDPGQFLNCIAKDDDLLYLCNSSADQYGEIKTVIHSSVAGGNNPGNIELNEVLTVDEMVLSICLASNNRLYLGSGNGLFVYYLSTGLLQKAPGTDGLSVNVLLSGSDQNLWIGTSQSGLGSLNLHTGEFNQYQHNPNSLNSLAADVVFSLFEDFSGNLWVGHGGEGISIINLLRKPFNTFRFDPTDKLSLSSNTIFCFNESDKDILIGTRNSGLNLMRYNTQKGRYVFRHEEMPGHFNISTPYEAIWDIQKESPSTFWLATNFGLIKMERQKGRWTYSQYLSGETKWSEIKRKIFIDPNLNLWVGSYNGIYLIPAFNRSSMEAFVYRPDESDPASLSDNVITSFLLDRNGNFWIGTQNGGLNLLKAKYHELDLTGHQRPDLEFFHFYASGSRDDYLNNNEINCMYEHSDGTIWVGTQGGGINIIDPDNYQFSHLAAEDGLPGDDVFSILPDDDGNLWCSTNKGLSFYDHNTFSFKNYTPQDGIQGNVFMVNSYFKSSDGKMFFGGRHGMTCFEPDKIRDNIISPKLSFTGLDVFNMTVGIGEKINGKIILPEALSEMGSLSLTQK